MAGRGPAAVVLLGACALAAACTGVAGQAGQTVPSEGPGAQAGPLWPGGAGPLVPEGQQRWWPVASAEDLTATGIEVAGASGVESVAVDGAGDVWLAGPWRVTRVDLDSGQSQSWDVSDDITFATALAVRPARAGGVWLVLGDRLRHFDGQRFVRDLPVPAAYRGGAAGQVNDMLEVGSEVWVSSPAGIARCTGESWSHVGAGQVAGAGPMAVDSTGQVWTLAQTWTGVGFAQRILRFGAGEWSVPDAAGAPPDASEIVAEPRGGVLVRSGGQVFRFDGLAWRELGFPAGQAVAQRRLIDLAVGPAGDLVALGPDGLARAPAGGSWARVLEAAPGAVGVGTVGDRVVVADRAGLSLLEGDRLEQVWADSGAGPVASGDGVVAVSAQEAWVLGPAALWQTRAGRWRALDANPVPAAGSDVRSGPGLALATDAAVWAITEEGVVRYLDDERLDVARDRPDERLLAGADGSVWAVETIWPGWTSWYAGDGQQGRTLTRIGPDGSTAEVSLPGVAWSLTSLTAGPDGSLWATICADDRSDYCTEPDLMHWDGGWAPVPYPGMRPSGLAATAEGGLWATVGPESGPGPSVLAYHSQGRWATFPDVPPLDGPVLAPDGSLCGVAAPSRDLVCVDREGDVRSHPMGVPGTIGIAADGSVWVVDRGQVARLPVTIPW